MTQPRSQLPSIGPPIQTWGSSRKCTDPLQRRKDKVSLWSAVALQQHFTANGVLSAATLDGQDGSVSREGVPLNMQTNEAPPPRPNGRLTLAQKMGLVPTPPRAPTDDDWKAVEQRAILREEQQTLGAHVCGICYETFASTMDQGQLILSCTHVFHERCFRQFERFVRAQQRADGNTFYTRLACPECREVHFHKRMYFAGKAMAQRAAIIKIQALIRGALARRAYCKLRLRQDEAFRSAYVSHRLAKLSAAWEAFLNRQDRDRDVLLTEISVRQQAAAAAALTEDGWESIIHRRRLADRITALPSDEVEGTLPFTSTHGDHDKNQTWVEKHECAICLEAIQRDLPSGRWSQNARSWLPQPTTLGALALGDDTRSPPDGNNEGDPIKLSGEAYVLLVRQRYEEKKKKAEADERRRQKKKTTGHQRRGSSNSELPSMRSTLRFSMVSKSIPSLSHDRGGQKPSSTASTSAKKPSQPVVPTPAKEGEDQVQTAGPARVLPRNGTILSCGHCFHEACLSTFERYTMWRSTDESSPIVAFRCPLCRSGYARHPF